MLDNRYCGKNKLLKGFTLIELVTVVIIIGVLASLGVTQYIRVRERALDNEVIALLNTIKAAEQSYLLSYGKYYNAGGMHVSDINAINANLGLNLDPTNKNWWWSVAAYLNGPPSDPNYFTIYANRNSTAFYRQWRIYDDSGVCCKRSFGGCSDSVPDCPS